MATIKWERMLNPIKKKKFEFSPGSLQRQCESLYLPVTLKVECPVALRRTVGFPMTARHLGKDRSDWRWSCIRDRIAGLLPTDCLSPAISTSLFIWNHFDVPRGAADHSPRHMTTLLVNVSGLLIKAQAQCSVVSFAVTKPSQVLLGMAMHVVDCTPLLVLQLKCMLNSSKCFTVKYFVHNTRSKNNRRT